MKTIAVDASVAIKWFLPEIHYQSAVLLLKSKYEIIAPDLILAEFGNILWKKTNLKEITPQQAEDILKDFIRFPIQTVSSKFLLSSAYKLAYETSTTVYDCLYLVLAQSRECSLVTADKKFYESITKKRRQAKIIWIEDFDEK